MSEQNDSQLLFKGECEACGSSDANGYYDDGHTYCHKCETFGRHDGEEGASTGSTAKKAEGLINGTVEALTKRKIDDRVCAKYGYQVGTFNGTKCHIAPYVSETGEIVAQQIRLPGKDFPILGDLKKALPLWGQHLCRDGGKMIVVTEGQIDAMSVCQAMGLTWPAVSLPNGAKSAKKAIAKALPFLSKFEKIVLCFDEDEDGREALEDALPLLPPGKAFVTSLPLKDANDMVKAGRSKELLDAVWSAHPYKPSAIVDLDDIMEDACTEAEWGLPWPFVEFTKATYGIRRGALYVWGSGTGSGKSTLMKQLMLTAMRPELGEDHATLADLGWKWTGEPRKVGCLFFEEAPSHTLKTLGGMAIKKRVHVPGTGYDKEAHAEACRSFKGLLFPMRLRSRSWEEVKHTVRYLHAAEGIEDFFIDPMTALVATADDERRALDAIMAELAGLAEELNVTIHLVSHLATPEGKSHEDGGRILEKHFRGSRAVAYWAHYLIGLERDKQDPKCPTSVRGLKDRLTGDAVGVFCAFTYNRETGLMEWCPIPEEGGAFQDETDSEL